MKFRVSKCCCCFNLKYGFITFGVISLIFRFVSVLLLWASAEVAAVNMGAVQNNPETANIFMMTYSLTLPSLGYLIASIVALFIAVRGIMKEKSILIFPYLVVMILEMIAASICYLFAAIIVTPIFLISLVLTLVLNIYIFLCLWSLYKGIAEHESDSMPLLPVSFSNNTVSMQKLI